MLKQFEINIQKNQLFSKNDKLLVAFSGGIDSVVLSDLLHKTGYKHDLAHCNFQLRGFEANGDTEFCETFAKQHQQICHVAYFQTAEYAHQNKLSIQMAARDLRYNWFKELTETNHYDYILTAHHANDNVETLFVNLIRGTGLKGLQGIPEKQRHIVRPLLFATKEDIKYYASENNLTHREDSSNQEVKYKRNFIRHNIIPELKKLNPSLEETFSNSIRYFKQSNEIIEAFAKQKFIEICTETPQQLSISIEKILNEEQKETLLFEWLNDKGFKTQQIIQLIDALQTKQSTGKRFESESHQLTIDRSHILVQQKQEITQQEYIIKNVNDTEHLPIPLSFSEITAANFSSNKHEIIIPFNDHLFPLTLRKWKQGDKFKPLGMTGFKKLSDFFKDQKLSLFDKQNVWILTNKEHIIWIVGYRLDDRFRVNDSDSNFLKINLNQ